MRLAIIVREFRFLMRTPLMWFCMIFAPLLCLVIFTTMMDEGLPQKLPLGIVDLDNTATTRNLARNLSAFQMTDLKTHYNSVREAREAMQDGDIYGFYYIPRGTTRKANRQEQPKVSFYMNYSFIVAGSLLYKDQRMMSELASGAAVRQVFFAKGATMDQVMGYVQPIVIDAHPINNPWLNYNIYLSNCLIPGVFGLFIFMVTVYSLGQEVKFSRGRELMKTAHGNIMHAIFGKMLPQLLVWLIMGCLCIWWLYGHLHFPCLGGVWRMLIIMSLFVFASQCMGLIMFAVLPTPRLSLSFASLWGVMSFSISGLSYPVIAMHPMLQSLAWLFPLRHYALLYFNTALNGYSIMNDWPQVAALLGFGAVGIMLLPMIKKALLYYEYEL